MAGDGFGGRDGAAVQRFDAAYYVGHACVADRLRGACSKCWSFCTGVRWSMATKAGNMWTPTPYIGRTA